MPKSYHLRKRELLRKMPANFIYNYYLKMEIKLGKKHKVPFRIDHKPDYMIRWNKRGTKIIACDWAREPEKYHDVFEMVKRIHKLDTFEMVLDILERDTQKIVMWNRKLGFKAINQTTTTTMEIKNTNSYQTMDFTYRGERYWNFQSIDTDTLEKFNVKQVRNVTYGEKTFGASDQEVFAYKVNGSVKIYQPQNKAFKHTYVKKEPHYVFGMKQLPETHSHVVITGSEKEVMALYGMGIPAVAVESETVKLSESLVEELKSRFKGVFMLYDNDKVGREKSKELAEEYNLLRLEVPSIEGVKDFTEWVTFDSNAGGQLYEQMADVVLDTDFVEETDVLEEDEEEQAPPFNPNKPYVLNWDTMVKPTKPLISVGGIKIGSRGNISAIVSQHGYGKSSACELIACKLLKPELDICGIETPKKIGVLYVDTERSKQDVSDTFDRIYRRLNVAKPKIMEHFEICAMIDIRDVNLKLDWIEEKIKSGLYGLLILDGIGDLVSDVNNPVESNEAIARLRKIANKYNISVLNTLHMNPSNTKARGHLGSELLRRSESILAVLVDKQDGEKVFSLTTDIKQSKLRNDGGEINMPFAWSKEARMMMPFDGEIVHKEKSRAITEKEYWEIAKKLLDDGIGYTHKEIATMLAEEMSVTYDTARSNHLKKLIKHEIVVQVDGKYYLNNTADDEEDE